MVVVQHMHVYIYCPAYLPQDFAFDYSYLAESFETSVPWSRYVVNFEVMLG